MWLKSGGKLIGPTETSMVFLDLEDAQLPLPQLIKMSSEHGLKIRHQRLVVHYPDINTSCRQGIVQIYRSERIARIPQDSKV
ncbi:hypothetical protein V8E51_013582 [Hyaloscypha variabilis]